MGSLKDVVQKYSVFLNSLIQAHVINNHMPTKTPTKKTVTKVAKTMKTPTKKKTTTVAKKKAVSSLKKPKTQTNFKALVCAYDGECFWSSDGRILENLTDLKMAFGSMNDEVFLHHVSAEKNDFADWVESVLQDSACAEDLRNAQKRAQAEKIVAQHLEFYNI